MSNESETKISFVTLAHGAHQAVVRREWDDELAAALLNGEGCSRVASDGRGDLEEFRFNGHRGLIRTYRRGGAAGPLLGDRMFLVNRPLRELRLTAYLFDRGLPVPNPLGCRWTRNGVVYRGVIATERLDAQHLQDAMLATPERALRVLRDVGETIRRFHDVGVFHADLQIRNILVNDGRVFLIDFDRARSYPMLTPHQRWNNLLRLRRSLEKNGFPSAYFNAVGEGYGAEALPQWLDWAYRWKGRASDRLQGRESPRP